MPSEWELISKRSSRNTPNRTILPCRKLFGRSSGVDLRRNWKPHKMENAGHPARPRALHAYRIFELQ